MNYEFLEVTSGGRSTTYMENIQPEQNGITVMALQNYFDSLPDKPNVVKINKAVVADEQANSVEVYFIPESIIDKFKYEPYLKSCNSFNKPHPAHTGQGIPHLVQTVSVPATTLKKIYTENQVESLFHLVLNTEGDDSDILLGFADYLATIPSTRWPTKITFKSTDQLTNPAKAQEAVDKYISMNYIMLVPSIGYITVLGYNG